LTERLKSVAHALFACRVGTRADARPPVKGIDGRHTGDRSLCKTQRARPATGFSSWGKTGARVGGGGSLEDELRRQLNDTRVAGVGQSVVSADVLCNLPK